jgi:hypothetical protein
LLARNAIARDLHFKTCRSGLLNHLAYRQPYQGGHAQLFVVRQWNLFGDLLRAIPRL